MSSVSIPPIGRANAFSSMGFYIPVINTTPINNCTNTLCYTANHNYIYRPHTGYGKIGTSAAGYLASRKRL